jgi:hypothetical protein
MVRVQDEEHLGSSLRGMNGFDLSLQCRYPLAKSFDFAHGRNGQFPAMMTR